MVGPYAVCCVPLDLSVAVDRSVPLCCVVECFVDWILMRQHGVTRCCDDRNRRIAASVRYGVSTKQCNLGTIPTQ